MQILKAKYIVTSDENFTILQDKAIAFDDKILAIADANELIKRYKNANFIDLKEALIAPAFVNAHVHLEFSSNKSELIYGDFITWLGSIIQNGANLAQKCTKQIIQEALNSALKSGTATFGAISSFGKDLEILSSSQARVVFFNEILGSNPEFIEQNRQNFITRFNESKKYANDRFSPGISLHSPYSIHPKLAEFAINFAKENNLVVSTHFLESKAEMTWLKNGTGKFKNHLKRFVKEPKPMYDKDSYFAMFKGIKTLFTHCVYEDDFTKFDQKLHSVTHCAVSNRLLGKKALNLNKILSSSTGLNIGTDGLSSNISLNLWHELRAALFTHANHELNTIAKILFTAATRGGGLALGTNNGIIAPNKLADIAVYDVQNCDKDALITQLILHTNEAKELYIGGKICNF
ncbi:metal-dependent hydrolase [Campylobacter sp. RM12920]|uniref:Metal-dependent hydrolase n=1 Tax=Campylobacter californiensis TaxID=1032243 RepID=A0ABD4JH58_9BACT|nr:metal-dependent hydrolase [Campylobacter sp. RM12919]MBE2988763.1 metal-dependent hydrolase [Campylobacter sp. RM12920]